MNKALPEARAAMPAIERIALVVMAFALAAMNGKPFFASSGIFCLIGTLVLATSHIRRYGLSYSIPKPAIPTVQLWGLWVFFATVSMLANFGPRTLDTWAWSYLLPFVMMISVLATRPSSGDLWMIIGALLAGWCLRFGLGVFVFYSTWGSLSVDQMMSAHFNLVQFAPYAEATYGSTGRTVGLIVPAIICSSLGLLLLSPSNIFRLLMLTSFIILAVSGLIVGSRAFFIVTIIVVLIAAFRSSARQGTVILGSGLALILAFGAGISAATRERFISVLTGSRLTDASVSERYDSIVEGYNVMIDQMFGIGPGMSSDVMYYTVPHQFAIFQGAELGLPGFVAVIALYIGIALRFLSSSSTSGYAIGYVLRASAFGWFSLAMLANSPIGEGANIPWIALTALLLALSEVAPMDRKAAREPGTSRDAGARAQAMSGGASSARPAASQPLTIRA